MRSADNDPQSTVLIASSDNVYGSTVANFIESNGYEVERWEGKLDAMTDAMDSKFFSVDERPEIAFEVHVELLKIYDELTRNRR